MKLIEEIMFMFEQLSIEQLDKLKDQYEKVPTIDQGSQIHRKVMVLLKKLNDTQLTQISNYRIKFLSDFARKELKGRLWN